MKLNVFLSQENWAQLYVKVTKPLMYTLYALCIKNGFDKCIFVQFKFSENLNLYSSLDVFGKIWTLSYTIKIH